VGQFQNRFRLCPPSTSNQAGYHSANTAAFDLEDTIEALANLATAADRSTVTHLTAINAPLAAELSLAATQLTTSRATIAYLQV
jgi:hypothetical protein